VTVCSRPKTLLPPARRAYSGGQSLPTAGPHPARPTAQTAIEIRRRRLLRRQHRPHISATAMATDLRPEKGTSPKDYHRHDLRGRRRERASTAPPGHCTFARRRVSRGARSRCACSMPRPAVKGSTPRGLSLARPAPVLVVTGLRQNHTYRHPQPQSHRIARRPHAVEHRVGATAHGLRFLLAHFNSPFGPSKDPEVQPITEPSFSDRIRLSPACGRFISTANDTSAPEGSLCRRRDVVCAPKNRHLFVLQHAVEWTSVRV
jgi:hypothetical protein